MALLNTNIGPERVQVFPVPIGSVQVPGVATSVTAFLVSTNFVGAPLNIPTSIQDFDTFQNLFGTADNFLYDGFYAVKGFYDNAGTGNTAIIVNVGTSPTAESFIGDASAGTGLRALDLIDVIGLVEIPGLPLSLSYLVDPAVVDYVTTVRADFGATLSTTFGLLAIPKEISQAQNDQIIVPAASATIASISSNTVTLNPVSLSAVTPGMVVNLTGVNKSTIVSVNPSLNQITLVTVSGLSPGNQIDIVIPSAINYKNFVVNNPSQGVSWYYNNPEVIDLSVSAPPNTLTTISPLGHVAGVIARIDANVSIGGVSHAPAGIQFAGLAGINGLSLSISERIDAGPLRLAFINRITSFPNSGNIIFGGYTANNGGTADQQLIQVIRSLQFIKGSLEPGLRPFLWENFSPDTLNAVVRAIEAFLRANIYLFPSGLPESQQFQVAAINPSQEELDEGLLRVRVLVRPNTAVRFIEVSLEYPLPTA